MGVGIDSGTEVERGNSRRGDRRWVEVGFDCNEGDESDEGDQGSPGLVNWVVLVVLVTLMAILVGLEGLCDSCSFCSFCSSSPSSKRGVLAGVIVLSVGLLVLGGITNGATCVP